MGKRGQKHWTTEQAKDVLREWRASGLSASAFAARAGLRRNRVNWWRKRLHDWTEEVPLEGSLKLVPLIPSEVIRPRLTAATMRLPGDLELEFDGLPPPEWVAAVVREVARPR